MNYKMNEVNRMLQLVSEYIPLGRDEWERLATTYNGSRGRGWANRVFESLRRKFKQLYCTRKPTGVSTMPPHIEVAHREKANVVEMDDEADADPDQDRTSNQPDFCFEYDPDESLSDQDGDGGRGLGGIANTPRPAPTRVARSCNPVTATNARSSTKKTTRNTNTNGVSAGTASAKASTTPDAASTTSPLRSRDEREAARYPKLKSYSNRLGGVNLAALRDTVTPKRAAEGEEDLLEASYAKAKRIRAMKATTALKQKLETMEQASSSMGDGLLKPMTIMCKESEQRTEARLRSTESVQTSWRLSNVAAKRREMRANARR
ncbi:hypothetical protein PF001_g8865 [Phytophthora fragariae]|uniref:DUF6818 domain-containing protein n=1 Tax=Phytophthora fragariae TaxID=53985 RepID=A0A6A4DW43_9STRA|nr:hypothetical protein PF001_g8865 [Phytophthora fragariae]